VGRHDVAHLLLEAAVADCPSGTQVSHGLAALLLSRQSKLLRDTVSNVVISWLMSQPRFVPTRRCLPSDCSSEQGTHVCSRSFGHRPAPIRHPASRWHPAACKSFSSPSFVLHRQCQTGNVIYLNKLFEKKNVPGEDIKDITWLGFPC
jgi:hypothetical protein